MMLDVLLDAVLDSLKVFLWAYLIYFILSFFEHKLIYFFVRNKKVGPIFAASSGLIPQCGISVVAADLFHKKVISFGTILTVFFVCSDEALPILLTQPDKYLYILYLLIIKFIFGIMLGYLIDYLLVKNEVNEEIQEMNLTCCKHHNTKLERHLIHPLIHASKILLYVFIVNIIFGFIIYFLGEDKVLEFLKSNFYLAPILTAIIGLIPNCASSVLMTELFINNGIAFGALITGLCVNAGLGIVYLLKFKEEHLNILKIVVILLTYSILVGYLTMLMFDL